MLFRDLAVLAAAISDHGAFASVARKPVHHHTGYNNDTHPTSSTGGIPYLNGTLTVAGTNPTAATAGLPYLNATGISPSPSTNVTAAPNQPMPGQGNGTAASCDAACREDFKNRTLLMNAASAATYALDQMDLWEECWNEPTCQNAVALMVGGTVSSLNGVDRNSNGLEQNSTIWNDQGYADFIITMGNKAALHAMSGTYFILRTLVAGVNEPGYLSLGERKLLWDIGQLSSFVADGPAVDEKAFAQQMRETTIEDTLMPDWMAAELAQPTQSSQVHSSDIQARSSNKDDDKAKKLAPLATLAIVPPALAIPMFDMSLKMAWAIKHSYNSRILKPFDSTGGNFIRKLNTAYNTNMARGKFLSNYKKGKRRPSMPQRGKPPNDFTRRTVKRTSTKPPKRTEDLSQWRPKANRPEVTNVWPWEHPSVPDTPMCYDGAGVGLVVVRQVAGECLTEPWQGADVAVRGGVEAVKNIAPVASGVIGAAAKAGKVMFDAADPVGGFLSFLGLGGGHHGGHHGDGDDDHDDKPTHHPEPKPEPTKKPTSHHDEGHSTTSSSERHSTPSSTASSTLRTTTSSLASTTTPSNPNTSSTLPSSSSAFITSPPALNSSTPASTSGPSANLENIGITTIVPISLVPFGSAIPTGGVAIGTFSAQFLVAPSSAFPSTFNMAALTGSLQPFGMVPTASASG